MSDLVYQLDKFLKGKFSKAAEKIVEDCENNLEEPY